MNYTPKLSAEDVMTTARDGLMKHLPLDTDSAVCTGADLWQILLGASVQQGTVHGVCQEMEHTPSDATVRHYLNAHLRVEHLGEIEQQLNRALADQIGRRVFKRARETAIDYHQQAYYGRIEQSEGLWIRAQAKDGTTRFYQVATAYVIWRDMRVTLAIRFCLPTDDTVSVLRHLLKRLKAMKYGVKTLYLDRGFDGIRVMRFVSRLRLRAVIACTIRGKTGGTRALCTGRASYRTRYTFHSVAHGSFTATLAVCRYRTTARRTGRHRRRWDWMLFILIGCAFTPHQARCAYRRRFGIESSYRSARRTRARTTSPNPAIRFVLIALSFFLLNVWVALRCRFAQIPRRGHRLIRYAHFRLSRLIRWISLAFHALYTPISSIYALSPLPC
jgi:hypothetical protein